MGVVFDQKVLVVLATAPTGLGHLRVTEALRQGLSEKTRVEVMGVTDRNLSWIHSVTSRDRRLLRVMEAIQDYRWLEKTFSVRYRRWLRTHTQKAEKQLLTLLSQAWPQPETVVVVATHFGLAHQLCELKEVVKRKVGAQLLVAVVVTDDSPQEMWAVVGADVIFVPSNTTREKILSLLLSIGGPMPEVVTAPYPVSLALAEELTQDQFDFRKKQMNGDGLRLMVPVSGAAVQLDYYRELITGVTADGGKVTVVSRESAYTLPFLEWCRTQEGVEVVARVEDMRVVEAYETEHMVTVVGAEATKPSEQAFKALLTPRQRGGSILLLAPPVGRQERDNLAFLRRHRLIPSVDDQALLDSWCLTGNRVVLTDGILMRARHWRGVMLPVDGAQAAIAIKRLLAAGILSAMTDFAGFIEGHQEINSDGVKRIWERVREMVNGGS
jgi:hypothetical protein